MNIKRYISLFLTVTMLLVFGSCGSKEEAPAMYVEPAALTKEEQDLTKLLGINTEYRIYDFVADDSLQSVRLTTYELIDGSWKPIMEDGQNFSGTEGRIALEFNKIAEGLRTAIQSNGNSSAYTVDPIDDVSGMGCTTSMLTQRTELLYEQEIPLVIQIITSQSDIYSFQVEYFNHPEEYQKHGYEHVYAITAQFCQKKLSN